MIKRSLLFFLIIMGLSIAGCIKETYDMNMLSKRAHFSPTLAISAIKGNVLLSDIVKSGDTVIFDNLNFVKIIFKKDSILNIKPTDFIPAKSIISSYRNVSQQSYLNILDQGFDNAKGYLYQVVASLPPDTLDLGIEDFLSHLTGTVLISDPSIRLIYSNSFVDTIIFTLHATGKKQSNTIDLDVSPFILDHPLDTLSAPVSSSFVVDKNNSSLPELISMPPEMIFFSGTALMNISAKNAGKSSSVHSRFIGSLEVEIPMELRMNNLQFADTIDNFLADVFDPGSDLTWKDFEFFRIDVDVNNGFPLGASLEISLLDSISHQVLSTLQANNLLDPAPVDNNGKVTSFATSSASIPFTHEFFSSIDRSDKILFMFTMNTTENGAKDVKIYSDYRIDFTASFVLKPDVKIHFK